MGKCGKGRKGDIQKQRMMKRDKGYRETTDEKNKGIQGIYGDKGHVRG